MTTLSQLAARFDLAYEGDGDVELNKVATLSGAQSGDISFLSNKAYLNDLKHTQASAVILPAELADVFSGNKLISDQPYVTFALVADFFAPKVTQAKGIHPKSDIDATAVLADDVTIGAYTVISADVVIAAGVHIQDHVTIGPGCHIGADCVIKSGVVIEHQCQLGQRVTLHPGAVIGADGFGLARDHDRWLKIPQTGRVVIGDDCSIGANTTIDRGAIEDTVLAEDVHLDNQIQIGHNVRIGAHTVIAGCAAVAGSAQIGANCLIGGGAGVVGHIKVCDGVTIQAMALVTKSIHKPGVYGSVAPLQENAQWRKTAVRIKQLDDLAKRLTKLERKTND